MTESAVRPPVRRLSKVAGRRRATLTGELVRLFKEAGWLYPRVWLPISFRFLVVWLVSFIPGYFLYFFYVRMVVGTSPLNLITGSAVFLFLDIAIAVSVYHTVLAVALEKVIPEAKRFSWSGERPYLMNGLFGLVLLLALVLGGVFLVAPGLLLCMALFFGPTLHIDRQTDLVASLKISAQVFRRHMLFITCVMLLALVVLLGSLVPVAHMLLTTERIRGVIALIKRVALFGIPFLIVLPFAAQLLALLYRDYYYKPNPMITISE